MNRVRMGSAIDIRTSNMDGGMNHECCRVQEPQRPRLVLYIAMMIDEKEVFGLDEREMFPLGTII